MRKQLEIPNQESQRSHRTWKEGKRVATEVSTTATAGQLSPNQRLEEISDI